MAAIEASAKPPSAKISRAAARARGRLRSGPRYSARFATREWYPARKMGYVTKGTKGGSQDGPDAGPPELENRAILDMPARVMLPFGRIQGSRGAERPWKREG